MNVQADDCSLAGRHEFCRWLMLPSESVLSCQVLSISYDHGTFGFWQLLLSVCAVKPFKPPDLGSGTLGQLAVPGLTYRDLRDRVQRLSTALRVRHLGGILSEPPARGWMHRQAGRQTSSPYQKKGSSHTVQF
ncbi:hypothetical protein JHW43_001424 [Diplocarpon mali]|nr:hypothetical protein JHW43_001424 [Diplocarpon mali]